MPALWGDGGQIIEKRNEWRAKRRRENGGVMERGVTVR